VSRRPPPRHPPDVSPSATLPQVRAPHRALWGMTEDPPDSGSVCSGVFCVQVRASDPDLDSTPARDRRPSSSSSGRWSPCGTARGGAGTTSLYGLPRAVREIQNRPGSVCRGGSVRRCHSPVARRRLGDVTHKSFNQVTMWRTRSEAGRASSPIVRKVPRLSQVTSRAPAPPTGPRGVAPCAVLRERQVAAKAPFSTGAVGFAPHDDRHVAVPHLCVSERDPDLHRQRRSAP